MYFFLPLWLFFSVVLSFVFGFFLGGAGFMDPRLQHKKNWGVAWNLDLITCFPDSIACHCGVDQHRGRRNHNSCGSAPGPPHKSANKQI